MPTFSPSAVGGVAAVHPTFSASSILNATAAVDNQFPLDLFSGESQSTIEATAGGEYVAEITSSFNSDGATGTGSKLANSIIVQFTVNGTPTGTLFLAVPDWLRDPSPDESVTFRLPLTLVAGDDVGVVWGFLGAAQPQDLHAGGGRTISLLPRIAG